MSRHKLINNIDIFAFDKVIAFIAHILCERLTSFNPNATAVTLDRQSIVKKLANYICFGIDSRPAFAAVPQGG